MWSYYGSKTNIIKEYPRPVHRKIIEPFAGSARYALRYWENDVLLVDKYDVVVGIWQWLQKCSEGDILSLPRSMAPRQSIDDFNFDCVEAKNLMGFLCGFSNAAPRKSASSHKMTERPNFINFKIKQIAADLHKIKHWVIRSGSYADIENEVATWYIDPPYQHGGACLH